MKPEFAKKSGETGIRTQEGAFETPYTLSRRAPSTTRTSLRLRAKYSFYRPKIKGGVFTFFPNSPMLSFRAKREIWVGFFAFVASRGVLQYAPTIKNRPVRAGFSSTAGFYLKYRFNSSSVSFSFPSSAISTVTFPASKLTLSPSDRYFPNSGLAFSIAK